MDTNTFEALGLGPALLAAVKAKGFEEPTPIQSLAIPRLLAPGPDLIARARTGTGKTAAFGLPLLERLAEPAGGGVRALVLVPTRELALQVTEEIASLKSGPRPRLAPVYGGASMGEQLRRLSSGVDIVVGTPGRVRDHLDRRSLDLSQLEFLVLDEADEMLDMGFIEEIEDIMSRSRPERRSILFSATMPEGVLRIAKRHLKDYEVVEDSTEAVTTELAEQVWLEVQSRDRLEALCRIMDASEDFFGIVFTATRVEAERLASELELRGYEAEALHGEISQDRRERTLGRFRERRLRILVATDVAARGIDIEKLSHVVNWSLPHDPESYLHRVGRTGRAGNAGTAVTFVTPEEYRKLFRIRKASGSALKKGKVPAIEELLAMRKERLRGRLIARTEAFFPQEEAPPLPAAQEAAPVSEEPSPDTASPLEAAGSEKAPSPKKAASRKAAAAKASSAALPWLGLADELLGRLPPREALAAALFEAFGSELDPARYREIADASVDMSATARLFIGIGKRDAATPRSLASFVKRLSGLPDRLVGGIEIYENFSFLSLPFEAAQKVIQAAQASGALPPVRMATPRGGPQRPVIAGRRAGPAPREGRPAWKDRDGQAHKPGPRPRPGYKGKKNFST